MTKEQQLLAELRSRDAAVIRERAMELLKRTGSEQAYTAMLKLADQVEQGEATEARLVW